MSDSPRSSSDATGSDFVRDMIRTDLAAGKYPALVTRFPPEPNGYLHIGHAKSICLNFGVAEEFGGRCHLRFDDTNPETESPEYVEAIQRDIRWLGFDWGEHLYFASDYFDQLYAWAEQLVRDGRAYVDSSPPEVIREERGEPGSPGVESRWRHRPADESLDLLRRMRRGEFADGEHVLRAKIDMAADNMLLRDPILYRIRNAHHYRQGDAWAIYPMYDYAHCLEDAIEGVSHSLCTLEFDNNRALYDWVIEAVGVDRPRPEQTEFARLNLGYTVMSKRILLRLVEQGHVAGWDDPRMSTLSGMRRRGYTPEAIRSFAQSVGVAKTYNVIDVARLEHAVRDDLNHRAPRALGVLDPLELVIEDWPSDDEASVEWLDAPSWPHDVPREGTRPLPLTGRLWIEREDFAEEPPEGWHRLSPGGIVRLRHARPVQCVGVEHDADGEVVRLRCRQVEEEAADGSGIGTIHWVSAEHAVAAEVRLYDRLFTAERPGVGVDDFTEHLNPDSLTVVERAWLEPSLRDAEPGDRVQLERLGYFVVDPDSTPEHPVWNRTITLRDAWAKLSGQADALEAAERARRNAAEKAAYKAEQRRQSAEASEDAPLEPAAQAIFDRLITDHGLSGHEVRLLALDEHLERLFAEGLAAYVEARSDDPVAATADGAAHVAKWLLNELRGLAGEAPIPARLGGPLGRLVALVDSGSLTATAGKEVLATLLREGGEPADIVEAQGLARIDDDGVVDEAIDSALGAHPKELAAYREGKKALFGFFMGQVMQRTRGRADAQTVRERLQERLG